MSIKHVNILIGLAKKIMPNNKKARHCVEHDTLLMRGTRDQTEINTITIHYSTEFSHIIVIYLQFHQIFDIPVDVNEVMKEKLCSYITKSVRRSKFSYTII